ncbi:MAG TPA: hypothetical protein VLM85_14785 [Polyangiaceae bacterium]|nr:hypothetical protein [Polyangiaceae bacterium]
MSRASDARRHATPALARGPRPLPRDPRRHDAHYFDLAMAIAAWDEGAGEYVRFREDESSALDPPW